MPLSRPLAFCLSIFQVCFCQGPVCGWCLTCVGIDASSTSPGWSLLPLTIIIVLALVDSTMPPCGDLGISMRPESVTSLPDNTASTGLLCLSVGAHVHRGRSITKVSMWLLLCTFHIRCMTILGILGWAPTDNTQPKAWAKACLGCDPSHQV